MIRKHTAVLALTLAASVAGCDGWLTTEPQTILTDEQVWSDPTLVVSVLADYYDRIPQREGPQGGGQLGTWGAWGDLDEGFITQQAGSVGGTYGYGSWGNYGGGSGYDLMRDIHVAMQGVSEGGLPEAQKSRVMAELRFLRAWLYFEMVKRHGGVPLITEELLYDFSGNTENLRVARAAEAEIYDFIYEELEAIEDQLPNDVSIVRRATKGAVLALKSRAMLYAGSIAYHNYHSSLAQPIEFTDPNTGKLVLGIPENRSQEYYQKSLDASRELLGLGYSLLRGPDPSQAFHNIFVTENHNEVILVRDYTPATPKIHWFGMRGRPSSMKVDQFSNWAGSEISATLNVAENFDYLDGTSGPVRGAGDGTVAGQANWIFYDEIDDIYEGRDGRLMGTLLVPGRNLGNETVSLQAGVYVWNEAEGHYDARTGTAGSVFSVQEGGDGLLLTGEDGPFSNQANKSQSGLYIKKYLNPDPSSGRYSPGDGTWSVFFRLGEIYMNAAEAAYQLGLVGEAVGYVNTLRERAGFPPNSLTTLTMEKIQSERWAELAYEDHRLWDLKRWRIAHEVWDGNPATYSARLWVLFPYRIYRPGHPDHNKYVFDRFVTSVNTAPREFREGNYYSQIPQGSINNNPLLVQNPIQE